MPTLLHHALVLLSHCCAGLQEFARYYGFYAGADKAGQGAMAFGSNATNLQRFKELFR
jgi:hypothetical protein